MSASGWRAHNPTATSSPSKLVDHIKCGLRPSGGRNPSAPDRLVEDVEAVSRMGGAGRSHRLFHGPSFLRWVPLQGPKSCALCRRFKLRAASYLLARFRRIRCACVLNPIRADFHACPLPAAIRVHRAPEGRCAVTDRRACPGAHAAPGVVACERASVESADCA
jgi:hypothetical protein